VADVGSMDVNGTLKPLFEGNCLEYHGIDIRPGPNVDIVVSDPYSWQEIKDDTYDIVVSTQCLEHVEMPWYWIDEVFRICKPDGLVYICAPNTMPYHGFPDDCWRIWPAGMKALLNDAGFAVLACYKNEHGDTTGIARKPKLEERNVFTGERKAPGY
jgi:SAM-dependent methyltransferase